MNSDRKKGCMYGLAIGDALGAAVEFKKPGEFSPITCYRCGGPHSLAVGQWTDDTSMALALADSINTYGWDLDNQMKNYADWWTTGKYSVNGVCFDIGLQTRYALDRFTQRISAVSCADSSPECSGNGSIMRIAPVAINFAYMWPDNIATLAQKGEESSLPTHASNQCKSACRWMVCALAGLINGVDREEILDPNAKWLGPLGKLNPLVERRIEKGEYKTKTNEQVDGSGWVVGSLESALWAFWNSNSFEEAVLKAVNLGNDADTTGAVCGQFAGAYWGYSKIPESLITGLDKKDMIDQYLNPLLGNN